MSPNIETPWPSTGPSAGLQGCASIRREERRMRLAVLAGDILNGRFDHRGHTRSPLSPLDCKSRAVAHQRSPPLYSAPAAAAPATALQAAAASLLVAAAPLCCRLTMMPTVHINRPAATQLKEPRLWATESLALCRSLLRALMQKLGETLRHLCELVHSQTVLAAALL